MKNLNGSGPSGLLFLLFSFVKDLCWHLSPWLDDKQILPPPPLPWPILPISGILFRGGGREGRDQREVGTRESSRSGFWILNFMSSLEFLYVTELHGYKKWFTAFSHHQPFYIIHQSVETKSCPGQFSHPVTSLWERPLSDLLQRYT